MDQPLGTIVFTLAAGIFGLVLGSKTRVPSILFLLLFGILLGPQFAGLVQPEIFSSQLPVYISILVALILFEGGASLKFSQYHEISGPLRRLLTIGVLVTLVLVTLTVRLVVGFSWVKSILFGSIMIVTGPTVILPILQRVRVRENLHNILKFEAILIDPLGVVIAIVLFEFLLSGHMNALEGIGLFGARIALGSILGLAAGWLVSVCLSHSRLLRFESEELGGLFVMAINLFFYGIAEWILPESGLVVSTVAGVYVGNSKFTGHEQVLAFKKQITLLALSCLFILLSANVPIFKIRAVFVQGSIVIFLLIFMIRPLSVFISNLGSSKLSFREKLFLSFLAPRGIVSASLASLFALAFEEKSASHQGMFLPLAFHVITGTIVFYSVFSGLIAWILKVHEEKADGFLILGANPFGLAFGEELRKTGVRVTFLDTNPYFCHDAREKGFQAFNGSGFERDYIESLDLKGIGRMVALTPNHEVNVLSCQAISKFLGRNKVFRVWDKADSWDAVSAASYDESWGTPLAGFIPPEPEDGDDAWNLVETERFRTVVRKVETAFKVDSNFATRKSTSFPLFVKMGNEISFLIPGRDLSPGAEITYLEPLS